MFYVYRIVRRETGKSYFGWTSESLKQRWWRHMNCAVNGTGKALHAAMRKHGIDAFDFELFLEVGTESEAKLTEMYCIAGFKTNARRKDHWGYNLTDGGEGTTGCTHTEEARLKISVAKRGKPSPLRGVPKDPEAIAKTAAFNRGRKLTLEHRAKLSAAKLGKSRASSGPLAQSHKDQIRATLLEKDTKRKRIRDRILIRLTAGPLKASDLLSTAVQAESEPTDVEYARNVLLLLKKEGKVVQARFGFYELPGTREQ